MKPAAHATMIAVVAEPRREAVVDVGCVAAIANQEAADAQPFIVVKLVGAKEDALLADGPLCSFGKKGSDVRSCLHIAAFNSLNAVVAVSGWYSHPKLQPNSFLKV